MKKKLIVITVAALLMCAGCTSREAGSTHIEATPTPTVEATPEVTPVPTESVTATPSPTQSSAPKQATETKAPAAVPAPKTAQPTAAPTQAPELKALPSKEEVEKYIGESASSLTGGVGQPASQEYAPSCIGDGEDGEYKYDGYTVYTYRENGVETVVGVE